jgi:hypothetical protein
MAGITAQPGSPPVMFRAGAARGEASARAAAMLPQGILLGDISEFQPDLHDAAYLAWSRAMVIRALYGTTVDRAWYQGGRRDALHAGGAVFVGIYAYLSAWQDAAVQARALVNLAGPLRSGEKLICDIEEGPPGEQAGRWRQWSEVITGAYGQAADPWLYAGLSFSQAAGLNPQWVAAYRATEPSGNHLLWQFSASYPVPGVGVADCSRFNGTIGQLAAHGWQGTPASPPPVRVPPLDAGWTYGPPRNLTVTPGHHNFHASWEPPAGAPAVPDYYLVWAYEGTTCTLRTLMPDYPRAEDVASTGPDPGSLLPGTQYTLHVAAFGPGGGHAAAGVYASAVFTTGG